MALALRSAALKQQALSRAGNVTAHLTGVAAISAAGASFIDHLAANKRDKLIAAAAVGTAGYGISIYGHVIADRLIETVGDGIMGAGLLTAAFHAYPKLFAR